MRQESNIVAVTFHSKKPVEPRMEKLDFGEVFSIIASFLFYFFAILFIINLVYFDNKIYEDKLAEYEEYVHSYDGILDEYKVSMVKWIKGIDSSYPISPDGSFPI